MQVELNILLGKIHNWKMNADVETELKKILKTLGIGINLNILYV